MGTGDDVRDCGGGVETTLETYQLGTRDDVGDLATGEWRRIGAITAVEWRRHWRLSAWGVGKTPKS